MSLVMELTDETFVKEVVEAGVPVMVDFWAPWCGPCRAVAPTMEEVASEFQGRAKVVKVNVDENQGVSGAMNIRSIPTVAVFVGNTVVDMRMGALPKPHYQQMLNNALAGQGTSPTA
ncbi:MAG: thioredoxin [Deltaproteobacteria bacterium]|nr:thioredoxin [Deltaproteobacteria bacterium]